MGRMKDFLHDLQGKECEEQLEMINRLMGMHQSSYHLERDGDEIVMVDNGVSKKQVQKNLFAHLKKE